MAVSILVSLGILFFFWKSHRNFQSLPEVPHSPDTPPNHLTVIVPARNEAASIARCLASFRGIPVIVVNDASTDSTAQLARTAGATVIEARPLTTGHLGKPNACQTGADAAPASQWLLFVDADTWFDGGFTGSLLAEAERLDLAAASVFPHQACVTLAERMLLPYAFALYCCGVSARGVNDPKSPEALANGQCMLFRRDAYAKIGGHNAVSASIIEDIALARLAKNHGLRFRVFRGEPRAHVRMYDSFTAIWRGFEKNSFRFLLVNPLTAIQVIAASILATSWLPILVWRAADRQWLAASLPLLAVLTALSPVYRRSILLAPVAIYVFQGIALSSMAATLLGRKVLWKGRRV
jgi:cellulose synthase/poly-beta-1,6-N-acetylglucosamine synthase-like glycosyltransferase